MELALWLSTIDPLLPTFTVHFEAEGFDTPDDVVEADITDQGSPPTTPQVSALNAAI
jgi:hypothetical protein